jgi:nucleoside-diphosphate-sugar epimerase
MKYVVVGGDGWVARTVIAHFIKNAQIPPENIDVYGSFERDSVPIDKRVFRINKWNPKVEIAPVSLFVPTAFLTIEAFSKYSEPDFIAVNRDLIDKAKQYIKLNSPKRCILFSSGIVSMPTISSKESTPRAVYQSLKLEEEQELKLQCERSGTKLLICRLFNASGRYIKSVENYAIANFIYQAITEGRIQLHNSGRVWRRYADLGQIFEVCLNMSSEKSFKLIESGGEKVELHDLAQRIALNLNIEFQSNLIEEFEEHHYYSTTNEFEAAALSQGIKLTDLSEQIAQTRIGVESVRRV